MKRKTKPTKKKPLTEAKIQRIVDRMPGGLQAFCGQWGWLNFARKLERAHGIK